MPVTFVTFEDFICFIPAKCVKNTVYIANKMNYSSW